MALRTVMAVVMILAAGCGATTVASSPVCVAGSTQTCLCVGGGSGVQSCKDDGTGFAACVCTDDASIDTLGGDDDATVDAAPDVAIDASPMDGTTGCASGFTLCGGTCVDTSSESSHCGSCEKACGADQVCVASSCTEADGLVTDVTGAWKPIRFVPCGTGAGGVCTKAVAKASCAAVGKKLVAHASSATDVASLGASVSCGNSISYFKRNAATAPGDCLVGVSDVDWVYTSCWAGPCCMSGDWFGNNVPIPMTKGEQFGFVNSKDDGYDAAKTNAEFNPWGPQADTVAAASTIGCAKYFVACL